MTSLQTSVSPVKLKRVFYLILPFVMVVSVVLALLDFERRQSASHSSVVSAVNQAYGAAQAIINRFYWESVDTTIGITLQGTQQNLFARFVEGRGNEQEMDALFTDAFHRNTAITQIRWIDKDGVEQHRMNRVEGQLHNALIVVDDSGLQDKSGRYYVVEAQKLKSGYIYLSKLDLNIENGQIVQPYEPTIRLATPIRDSNNVLQGIIVVNFDTAGAFAELDGIQFEGIDIDIFSHTGQLRYSNSVPSAAFLDLLKGDVLNRGEEAIEHYYDKSKIFTEYALSSSEEEYYKSSEMNYAPQIKAQEKLVLLVSARASYLEHIFKHNSLGALLLGSLTLFLGIFLMLLLHRAERKVMALNMALNEQLKISEHSRAVKSQFLANMSHEIRTPMTAISGLLALLLKERLDGNVRQRLNIIKESSDGLRRIINDILDLSKIESGKSVLSEVEFRPALTVERCVSTFNGSANLNGIELFLDMEPSLFFYHCQGDEYRIEQVINNLLSNAIKFSKNKPVLICITSQVCLDSHLAITCKVIDQGVGMSDRLVTELGESFTQADNSMSNENTGTGLGLSISKALLHSMGSDLCIKSQLGVGSEFSFTLNLKIATKEDVSLENKIDIDDLKIWLVNTDNQSSQYIHKIFHHWGGHVTQIKSSEELKSVIEDNIYQHSPLDFILFDLEHSVCEDDVTYTIHRFTESHKKPPKVVVITSDERRWPSYNVMGTQVDVFKKPITISGFLELLQKLKLVPTIQSLEGNQEEALASLECDIRDRVAREGQPSILLVEDNVTNQNVISEIFSSVDISVNVVNNGLEAVNYVEKNAVDMILMDVQMPVMDGLEATEIIRTQYSREQLPIIALSAGVTEQEFEQSEKVGMNTHLPKPIDLNKLMNVVIEFWPERPSQSLTLAELKEVEGFDLTNTIYQWLGADSYMKVLSSFLSEFSGIDEPQSQEDKIAFAHKLKGASGNIGAIALHELSTDYEKRLKRENVTIKPVLEALENTLLILARVS